MFCPKCGHEARDDSAFCPTCGFALTERKPAGKMRLSTIAGILDIVCGALAFVGVLFMTIGIIILANDPYRHGPDELDPLVFVVPFAAAAAILGTLAIAGGIYALRRKRWGMALTGAIAALLPWTAMGIAALILTVLSRDEFE